MSVNYGSLNLIIKTLRCRLFGKPDIARWQDLHNFDSQWDERTMLIASLIPEVTRVIEFGVGRRKMESYLHPSCTYFPSDLLSRGEGTVICDLNARPLLDLRHLNLDVAVFGGVLEYVSDLPSIPPWLGQNVSICITSYEYAHSKPKTVQRIREVFSRMGAGWVNTYSEQELEGIFEAGGFFCSKKVTWETEEGDEKIFVFRKRPEQS